MQLFDLKAFKSMVEPSFDFLKTSLDTALCKYRKYTWNEILMRKMSVEHFPDQCSPEHSFNLVFLDGDCRHERKHLVLRRNKHFKMSALI